MASSKKKRCFSGIGYREVQRSNSHRRSQLSRQDQKQLKAEGYKNVGWDNVIALYQRINALIDSQDDETSLEQLFLKADRIGSKYQSHEEIELFKEQLADTVKSIEQKIDQQFPEEGFEFCDYSSQQTKPAISKTRINKRSS